MDIHIWFLSEQFVGNFIFKEWFVNTKFSIAIVCTQLNGFKYYHLLYSLHNGIALLHKYTSTERQELTKPPCLVCLSTCWGTLRSAVFWSARLGPVLRQHWRFPPASVGRPPGCYLLTGGFGLLPGAWDAPNKGNTDGAEGIFGNAGRSGLRPCDRIHHKNGLMPNSLVRWGAW